MTGMANEAYNLSFFTKAQKGFVGSSVGVFPCGYMGIPVGVVMGGVVVVPFMGVMYATRNQWEMVVEERPLDGEIA